MITRIQRTIAIGETVENIVAGRSIEFAADDSVMTLAAATTATGLTMSVRLTDEVILDTNSAVPFLTGGQPVIPDQVVIGRQPVARGDHLIISVSNPTAGALVLCLLIDISPI